MCNGATDNASGVAVVLAVGRAIRKLPTPPRRSVVLALWDAEEDGLLGSRYYVEHPLVPLAATRTYVNLDIQGSDLLPSLGRSTFAVSPETGGSALQAFVADADAAEDGLDVRPLSYAFGQGRSDYANFVAHAVPTVFLGDATNGCYHTVSRRHRRSSTGRKLAVQGRVAYRLAAALAETSARAGLPPLGSALASYGDAVSLQPPSSRRAWPICRSSRRPTRWSSSRPSADLAGIVAAGAAKLRRRRPGLAVHGGACRASRRSSGSAASRAADQSW